MPGTKITTEVLLPRLEKSTLDGVLTWVDSIIRHLSGLLSDFVFSLNEVIDGKFNQAQFTVLTAEPANKAEGWVVFADGTAWNPGAGRGLYEYRSGAWHKL